MYGDSPKICVHRSYKCVNLQIIVYPNSELGQDIISLAIGAPTPKEVLLCVCVFVCLSVCICTCVCICMPVFCKSRKGRLHVQEHCSLQTVLSLV